MTAKRRKRKLDRAAKRRQKKAPDTRAVEVVKVRAQHLASATHLPLR